jgi:5-methylcytosine-specific restriction endonuclease McrA
MPTSNSINNQYQEDFSELSGLLGEKERNILKIASNSLIFQKLVFSESVWSKICNKRNLIIEKLCSLYQNIPWQEIKINGESLWKFVNRLNVSVHTSAKTKGGILYKKQVAFIQKGEYCILCGSKENIHVDHIISVNAGGPQNDIHNMQLLCEQCNLGKSNFSFYDVSIAINVIDEESAKLRYRVLLDQGQATKKGVIGFCSECGLDASEKELKVVKKFSEMSYSYANLIVKCKQCNFGV